MKAPRRDLPVHAARQQQRHPAEDHLPGGQHGRVEVPAPRLHQHARVGRAATEPQHHRRAAPQGRRRPPDWSWLEKMTATPASPRAMPPVFMRREAFAGNVDVREDQAERRDRRLQAPRDRPEVMRSSPQNSEP